MAQPNGALALTATLAVACVLLGFTSSDWWRNLALYLLGFATMIALGSALIFYVFESHGDAEFCAVVGGVGLCLTLLTLRIVAWSEKRQLRHRPPHGGRPWR